MMIRASISGTQGEGRSLALFVIDHLAGGNDDFVYNEKLSQKWLELVILPNGV